MPKESNTAKRTAGITLDHVAGVYDKLSPLMTLGSERRSNKRVLDYIRSNISQSTQKMDFSVLDIGCGTGSLSIMIHDMFGDSCKVMGIDAAERMIDIANKKKGERDRLQFVPALAEELPCASESVDYVVSTFFFHHINYALKVNVLHEMLRVLKPNGQSIIVDVDIPYNLFGKMCAWSGYKLFNQPEILENIQGKLRMAIDESGFEYKIDSRYGGYISLFILKK